jgi:hypothetical protein
MPRKMIKEMIRKIIRRVVFHLIKKYNLEFYKIEELQPWSHCGCCGKYIKDDIVPREWPWGLCKECIEDGSICYKI